jgi:uncharacterized membrane protein
VSTPTAPDASSEGHSPAAAPADETARRTRALALSGTLGLIVLGLAWELWLAPTGSGTLAIKVVPLLLPLVGLWRYRMVTYRWLSLLVWLYVCEGAVRATSEGGLSQWLAALELVLALLLFVACSLHVRGRLARARARAAA